MTAFLFQIHSSLQGRTTAEASRGARHSRTVTVDLSKGDEHAHGEHNGEYGEGVALRLIERVYLVLRA